MNKKILNKLNKAYLKMTEAAVYLCQADDDLLTEEPLMVSKNMSLKDTVGQFYKDLNFMKTSLSYTISALKDETDNKD